jgi:mRNA interferase HigB
MRVISKARLREFWQAHGDAEKPLVAWWKIATRADWSNIQEVRATFPHADAVELRCGLVVTVFNVGGNKYRLITRIIYQYRRIYVKRVLTHKQYDARKWEAQLCGEHRS